MTRYIEKYNKSEEVDAFRLGHDTYPEWFNLAITEGRATACIGREPRDGGYNILSQESGSKALLGDSITRGSDGDLAVYSYESFKNKFDIAPMPISAADVEFTTGGQAALKIFCAALQGSLASDAAHAFTYRKHVWFAREITREAFNNDPNQLMPDVFGEWPDE